MIVAMWSGPRNLSTAMMRSFGSRSDTSVLDEPFFAPYLAATGLDHPGRAETLNSDPTDPQAAAARCMAETGTTYRFQKHMPHHMLPDFPMGWAKGAKHFFLIRHPARVIASYAKGRAAFTAKDLGYTQQLGLWEQLGQPPVVDCDAILENPETELRKLCDALGISFDPAMLSWAPGRRDTDGAWAPYWYASVETSTGFGAPPGPLPPVAADYANIYAACLPAYETLREFASRG